MKKSFFYITLIQSLIYVPMVLSDAIVSRAGTYKDWGFERKEMVSFESTRTKAALYFAGTSKKKTIVLVHGLGDNGVRDWREQVDALKADYFVVGVDLPGFGDSKETIFIPSPESYASFLKEVVDRYAKGDVHMMGHSLGGAISIWFAGSYPLALKSLVIIDAAGILHKAALFNTWTKPSSKPKGLMNEIFRFAEQKINDIKVRILDSTNTIAEMLLFPTKFVYPDFQKKVAMHLVDADFNRVLFNINVPSLIIWGEFDRIAPLRTGFALNHMLQNSVLKVFDSAHVPMIEQPKEFTAEVLKWFGAPGDDLNGKSTPTNLSHVGICKNNSDQSFEGSFKKILITNCDQVIISNSHVERLEIISSRVQIENSVFVSKRTPIDILKSHVLLTAVTIQGDPPFLVQGSRLDIAGARIINTSGQPQKSNVAGSLLFSISSLESGGRKVSPKGFKKRTPKFSVNSANFYD